MNLFINRLSLRWRIAILTTLAIAILSIIAALTAFFVVRSSLVGDLKFSLRRDAIKLAEIYSGRAGKEEIKLGDVPSGRIIIQIYDTGAKLYASSVQDFEKPESALQPEIVEKASNSEGVVYWQGNLIGQNVMAALAPFDRGVVVVLATTNFMTMALNKLSRNLIITAIILIVASALIGYVVAAAAMRPVLQLTKLTAEISPKNLQKLRYHGPDDELQKLSKVINDLICRLKESMDAQRIFLAETSHELRTPLTSLQGFLERASRRAHPTVKRDLKDAKRISQTMSRLVADLLQLSRGELVKEMVPHLLDPYKDIIEPIAEEYDGIQIKGNAGEILVGDPERLRQLIRNLVANAVRATKDAKRVGVAMERSNGDIVISVSDDGPGIPKDKLESIFDKFYKGPGGGAGLGLAIARQIAEAHRASLTVSSELGKGTVFSLKLKLVEDDEDL